MSVPVIKALCRRIEARLGGGKYAALAANVTPGVWSNYVSDEHPDTTIPFHRLLVVADAQEKAAFAELLTGEDAGAIESLLTESLEASEATVELQRAVREATADGDLTEAERRRLLPLAMKARAEVDDVIRGLDRP